MNLDNIQTWIIKYIAIPQTLVIISSIFVSLIASVLYRHFIPALDPQNKSILKKLGISFANFFREQLFILTMLIVLSLSYRVDMIELNGTTIINIFQTLACIYLLNRIINKFIKGRAQNIFSKFLLFPILILFFMDWLSPVANLLDSLSVPFGSKRISVYGVIKVFIFGYFLFWSSKAVNDKGKTLIKNQKDVDPRSKELFSKLFEISIFIIFLFLLFEILGIDFTTVAIFSGALGVGIGFGLQSIASNFISGLILLLDRSLMIGDHVELEDGKQGVVQELNMRCATITTFEGKDILIPNEKFITNSFTNWTHKDNEQRYSIKLQVAYNTDLRNLFDLLRQKIAEHPQVLSGENIPIEKRPDAEISDFCDSGVEILIEFWMEGIDDGENKVGADLLLMIWDTLHENNIEIPYPQREVRILNPA